MRDKLVKLLDKPLHVFPPLLNILADLLELLLLHLKVFRRRGALEHPGQAGVDVVHPANHLRKSRLVRSPLLWNLLELSKESVDSAEDDIPVIFVPGVALLEPDVLRHLLRESLAQSLQVLEAVLNLGKKVARLEELCVLLEDVGDIVIVVEAACLVGYFLLNVLDVLDEGVLVKSELDLHHVERSKGLDVVPLLMKSLDVAHQLLFLSAGHERLQVLSCLDKLLHDGVVVLDEEGLVSLHVLLGLDVLDGNEDLRLLDPLHHPVLALLEPCPALQCVVQP